MENHSSLPESLLSRLLHGEGAAEHAWEEFLREYSNLFLKIIWQFEKDHDEVMEKYLYVCERFADGNFAILRKFRADYSANPPKFSTWIAAVVRNMCVDVFRKKHPRRRCPKALMSMSEIDRKVFELYYWQGYPLSEIDLQLARNGQRKNAVDSLKRIEAALLRMPSTASPVSPTTVSFDEEVYVEETTAEEYTPEAVEQWLSVLPTDEKLVVRLKFWEGLTASEISRITGINPESRVYSVVETAMKKLRKAIERESKD